MANVRLRDAMAKHGFTPVTLATKVHVDPKTVERWITQDRLPYPKYRHELAALLHESENYLWPEALSKEKVKEVSQSEIVEVFPQRALAPLDLWSRLIAQATERIDILVMAGLFLPEQNPLLTNNLAKKAEAGVGVRLLFSDPSCEAVAVRGHEEGIGEAVKFRIQNTLAFFRQLQAESSVEIRLHCTTLYNSIHRLDDQMLVNTHVYGLPGSYAPLVHLRRLNTGRLFETYAASFEKVWKSASPINQAQLGNG